MTPMGRSKRKAAIIMAELSIVTILTIVLTNYTTSTNALVLVMPSLGKLTGQPIGCPVNSSIRHNFYLKLGSGIVMC